MRTYTMAGRTKRPIIPNDVGGIHAQLSELLIGQPEAIETIVPFVHMHQAGLRVSKNRGQLQEEPLLCIGLPLRYANIIMPNLRVGSEFVYGGYKTLNGDLIDKVFRLFVAQFRKMG